MKCSLFVELRTNLQRKMRKYKLQIIAFSAALVGFFYRAMKKIKTRTDESELQHNNEKNVKGF